MKHNDIRHKLSEYIDGSISAHDKAEIEVHLKTCRKCSDALNELRKTVEHIKTIEEVEPPAWMTQKIMAKVRAEAEKKKSWFRRWFFPLHIKLPLEAVAMMFLAVTVFYIYQSIHPEAKLVQSPIESFGIKDESHAPTIIAKEEPNKTPDSSLRSKQVSQVPEYKALDMKPEYEPPAPAAAKPGAVAAPEQMQEAKSDKFSATPKAQGGAKKEAHLYAAAKAKTAISEKEKLPTNITMTVKDRDAAEKEIEKALIQVGGKIIKREALENKKIFTATIGANRLKELTERLKTMGDIKETRPSAMADNIIDIRIELIQR
jgi:hypothetical protein